MKYRKYAFWWFVYSLIINVSWGLGTAACGIHAARSAAEFLIVAGGSLILAIFNMTYWVSKAFPLTETK